jgi:hypothetical protein
MNARGYNTKQMGDACEMLVAAELTLAGTPALRVPGLWPDYDVIAQPPGPRPAAGIREVADPRPAEQSPGLRPRHVRLAGGRAVRGGDPAHLRAAERHRRGPFDQAA